MMIGAGVRKNGRGIFVMNRTDNNRVALVTGAGRGIGAGCARALAAAGFKVALMSPSDSSSLLARELGGIGRQGSVLSPDDIKALVMDAIDVYGRIDAAVYNMGHGGGVPRQLSEIGYNPDIAEPLLEIDDRVWHESLDMYILGVVRLARAVTPIMLRQGSGSIVAISSLAAVEPRPQYPMSALRAALHVFVKSFADRYAPKNVRMNALMPGLCENVNLSEEALRRIPMQRLARFDEIGKACVFLASEASSYMTGQSLLVDGGINRGVR
jgi:NAD(P)-dependent dehydrogenase (short-subunit alcohol dehydrogenase family)